MDATQWQERIASELADLGQQEFAVVGEPEPSQPHYWWTVPQPEAELVPRLLVDAFGILGADFATLTLRRDQ